MQDVTIVLEDRPRALAELGEALAQNGISIAGGGAWLTGRTGTAHFLLEDGESVRIALQKVGFRVLAVREIVTERLRRVADAWMKGGVD